MDNQVTAFTEYKFLNLFRLISYKMPPTFKAWPEMYARFTNGEGRRPMEVLLRRFGSWNF